MSSNRPTRRGRCGGAAEEAATVGIVAVVQLACERVRLLALALVRRVGGALIARLVPLEANLRRQLVAHFEEVSRAPAEPALEALFFSESARASALERERESEAVGGEEVEAGDGRDLP